MEPEKFVVLCPNIECGEAHLSGFVGARQHRRMNYMGKREWNLLGTFFGLLQNQAAPPGVYYYYQCPVCGFERSYIEFRGRVYAEEELKQKPAKGLTELDSILERPDVQESIGQLKQELRRSTRELKESWEKLHEAWEEGREGMRKRKENTPRWKRWLL
jgi:hypothetical protein